MKVKNYGSVVTFTAESDEERTFLNDEIITEDWQWGGLGRVLAVDARFAEDLCAGCTVAGFEVRS